MDGSKQVLNPDKLAGARPKKPDSNGATMLGEAVKKLMEAWISPRQNRFESIAQVWSELLPAELYRHCKLAGMSGGQLKVVADSPSYMYELRLCSVQLLRELQRRCPQARIERIKLAIG